MEKQYHIAFATDVDFQIPLALALYSLERALAQPEQFSVHILHQGINTELYSSLGLDLHFYNVANALQSLPTARRFPTPIYYRFLLADILPPHVEKVLYLDCDIMVMRDISMLWDIPLQGAVLAACPWVVFGAYAEEYKPYVDQFPSRLGVPDESPEHYYYSSFLMMDLELMRQEKISSQLVSFSLELPAEKLIWPDQDVLNYVLRDRIASLPLACNVIPLFATEEMQNDSEEAREAYAQPLIIHFAATKPNILTGAKLPFEKEFFKLWRQSPWSQTIPYPLVSLRKLPSLLKAVIELPIKLAIQHDRILQLYGQLLSVLRSR